ncbi:MAG: hypothetical protein RLZZ283_236 [Candidatus Parcubacteria bacterium]|jgi:hypothetical protein
MDTKKLTKAFGLVAVVALALVAGSVFAATTSTVLPNAEGTYLTWATSSSTTHYLNVKESVCNGTTDYNYATTTGSRDSYAVSLSSVPNGAKVTQIAIKPCASRNTSGGAAPVMNVFYRLNGSNSADAGAYSLSGTTPTLLATTTFSSLNVIKVATSTLEIGAVLTSGTKGARLSRIATVVTYTELLASTSTTASSTGRSSIGLAWSDASTFEDGYVIERKASIGGTYASIATTTASATYFADTGLLGATGYTYRLRAFNAGGYSTYGNIVSATTTTLAAPSGLSASTTAPLQIDLGWTDNASTTLEDGYSIERMVSGGSFSEIATTTTGVVTYSDLTVSASTTYVYRVRGFDSAGYSSYSNSASSTTP